MGYRKDLRSSEKQVGWKKGMGDIGYSKEYAGPIYLHSA
jgi:hypothetical protein